MTPSSKSVCGALCAMVLMGCSSDDSSAVAGGADAGSASLAQSEFEIVTASGAPLTAFAGDAIELKVVSTGADGAVGDLPSDAVVIWTAPGAASALPPQSDDNDPLPYARSEATAAWVSNPSRPDIDLTSILTVLDPGTTQNASVSVSATVSGAGIDGHADATILIYPSPAGDWSRGAVTYAATCAACHGASGHGSPPSADGVSFVMNGVPYPFPAPGINAEPGNMAGDPDWNTALLAVAGRIDVDNRGAALRPPMPAWIAMANPATGKLLTTQDFADIDAFLKTQGH